MIEAEFTSRWVLVEGYHSLGLRILQENNNFEREKIYGQEIVKRVSISLGKGTRTIRKAVQLAREYPDLALLPEGKNTSWHKICNTYLGGVHVSHNSGENEWYTPKHIIESVKAVMGEIDLDPASSELANDIIGAKDYYTAKDDGLKQDWHGRVWLNPPYSQPEISNFAKAVTSKNYDEIMILVNNATETDWFRMMAEASNAICFINKRLRFIDKKGIPSGMPLQGQAIIYKGNNVDKFIQEFKESGLCMIPA
tara:strand:+ start:114 stop:872 length:759 start_codon:yes stop_codon:yes gene_type:complete